METPIHLQTTPKPAFFPKLARAAAQLETASKFALLCIFFGWFLANSLVVTLGSLQHGVRFFDLSAVIADPTRLFFGIQGSLHRILFGMVCILCLLAPLLPHLRIERATWLGYMAPLILMAICGALLYSRTSNEFLATPSDASRLGGSLIQFANELVHQGSGLVAKHISVGVGGYLGLVGSLVLAQRGARHYRKASV